MHKLILVFYIPRLAQTRAAQCLTNIEGKVCGRWQWRFGGRIRYIDGTQGDGHRCRGDERRVQKVSRAYSISCSNPNMHKNYNSCLLWSDFCDIKWQICLMRKSQTGRGAYAACGDVLTASIPEALEQQQIPASLQRYYELVWTLARLFVNSTRSIL